MDLSPFEEKVDEALTGERVFVESSHGNRFEGRLEQIQLHETHVILDDVVEQPGAARFEKAFIPGVDWIVVTSE